MTLENKLFELNTLVDYGTYYLSQMSNENLRYLVTCGKLDASDFLYDEEIREYAKDNLDMIDEDDALDYVNDNYDKDDIIESLDISSYDVLDVMSCYDICDYLMDNHDMEHILNQFSDNDLLTYVVCNLNYQDIINEMELRDDNILQYVDEDVIKNYVTSNVDVDDMVEWK